MHVAFCMDDKVLFLISPKRKQKVMFHMVTYYNYFVFTLLYSGKGLNYDSYMHRHVITLWCLQIVDVGLNFVVYKSLKEWLI